MDNCWTKWQIITYYLRKIISLGLHPGRCGTCGKWLHIDMVVPFVSGAVCYNCDYEYGLDSFYKQSNNQSSNNHQ